MLTDRDPGTRYEHVAHGVRGHAPPRPPAHRPRMPAPVSDHTYTVVAYIVMTYILMAYIVMTRTGPGPSARAPVCP